MRFDGAFADPERTTDLLVGQPTGHQFQNLQLAPAEAIGRSADLGRRKQGPRHPGIERSVALRRGPHCSQQVTRIAVLQQVPHRTGPQRVSDPGLVGEGGEDDHATVGLVTEEFEGGGNSVHHRHREVHQHHIWPQLGSQLEGPATVLGLPHHAQIVGAVDQCGQTGPNQEMVVDEENGDHGRGTTSRQLVP